MNLRSLLVLVTWASFACVLAADIFAQTNFKQLNADTGWIVHNNELLWTSDGGRDWENIAPPQLSGDKTIAAVFFLDTSRGWVVIAQYDNDQDNSHFWLCSTNDGGKDWATNPILIPEVDNLPQRPILTGNAYMYFWDSLHGLLALDGGGFARTSDGGQTWRETASPTFGPLTFTTPTDGWVLGNSARAAVEHGLFVTHDGAKSWQKVNLPGPNVGEANARYSLPTFVDKQHGFLMIEYPGPGIASVALLSSTDCGRTWKQDYVLRSDPNAAFAVVNSQWRVVKLIKHRLSLTSPAASAASGGAAISPAITHLSSVTFVDAIQGWAFASGQLLSTSDSGKSWTNITQSQMRIVAPKTRHQDGSPGGWPTRRPLGFNGGGPGYPLHPRSIGCPVQAPLGAGFLRVIAHAPHCRLLTVVQTVHTPLPQHDEKNR